MKRLVVLSFLLAVCGGLVANAPPVAAADLSLESRTYLPARGIDGGDTHVLLYEYLSLDVEDLAQSGLYLRLGGWGRTDLADETFDEKTQGELQYGFVGWRAPRMNAEGRLGRIALSAGVARNEVFDGALLGSDLPGGFDLTLYGGVPVETEDGGRSDDTLYGARLSQGRPGLYRIGASYLKEEDAGEEAREEAGVDLFVAPLPLLEAAGSSVYNVIDEAWARHEYRVTVGPFAKRLRLIGSWAFTDYEHYFQAPGNPIFAIPVKEELTRLAGEVELVLGQGFTLTGEYIQYSYDLEEDVPAWGARLDWAGSGIAAGAGYRLVDGDADEGRYEELHARASTTFGALQAAVGVQHLIYDPAVNGEKDSTTGSLTLDYALSQTLEISATAEYGVTPEFEREVSGLLALVWRYDASTKKGGTK